jgi:glutaminyl-tRNA synthetase
MHGGVECHLDVTHHNKDHHGHSLNSDQFSTRHHRRGPQERKERRPGHAKSICLNFGLARDYGGNCHLRFDDTNPGKEDPVYVASIKEDVHWLGFDWGEHLYHASDYFERLYEFAVELITKGKAYVCSLSAEQMREYRGTLTEPGKNSPYRDRSVEENLDLFARMRAGEFPGGTHILRAKIDMASPNMNMRDPALYRILHQEHQNTGNAWCIYPMYDFAHGLSDSIEHITHSICTLEFADHKPLYDWILDQLDVPSRPVQYEFNRLNINFTVTSKRKLKTLVDNGVVAGWNDPRMPTISGLRRRGFPPAAIRDFCERVGVSRSDSCVDMGVLESCVRENLDADAPRAMAVLRPLRLVIENYPEGQEEFFELANHPKNPDMGTRKVGFSREVFIEADDFMENPPGKFFRLAPGREVRLRGAYLVTCTDVVRDADGNIETVVCTYDPASRGGDAPDGRKVKGTLHWVSARHCAEAEVRLYDRLFTTEFPGRDADFLTQINPSSLEVLPECKVEASLAQAGPEARFQFERQGFFCADRFDHEPGRPVFNRTVTLRDSWAKVAK